MSTYSDIILANPNLAHYYRCSATSSPLVDLKGSENLTVSGTGITFNQTGLITKDSDGSFDTTAATSGIAKTSSHTQVGGTTDFTYEFWLKSSSTSANVYLVGEGNTSTNTPYLYVAIDSLTSGKLRFRCVNSANSAVDVSTSGTYNDGNPHYVALVGTRSTNTLNLYVDDVRSGAVATTSSWPAAPISLNKFAIGGISRTTDGSFANYIYDEVATYTAALSTDVLYHHYTAGKAQFGSMF